MRHVGSWADTWNDKAFRVTLPVTFTILHTVLCSIKISWCTEAVIDWMQNKINAMEQLSQKYMLMFQRQYMHYWSVAITGCCPRTRTQIFQLTTQTSVTSQRSMLVKSTQSGPKMHQHDSFKLHLIYVFTEMWRFTSSLYSKYRNRLQAIALLFFLYCNQNSQVVQLIMAHLVKYTSKPYRIPPSIQQLH